MGAARATVTVRPEAPGDLAAIRVVHERAFERVDEAGLVDALRASGASVPELCLVAVEEGTVVGHVAYSRASVSAGALVLALAPLAVLPERQRRGIGAALLEESLARAARTGYPLVLVVGHAGYYPRFGFEPAGPLGLRAPFPVPSEAWLAYRLPSYRPAVRGAVSYAKAFAALE